MLFCLSWSFSEINENVYTLKLLQHLELFPCLKAILQLWFCFLNSCFKSVFKHYSCRIKQAEVLLLDLLVLIVYETLIWTADAQWSSLCCEMNTPHLQFNMNLSVWDFFPMESFISLANVQILKKTQFYQNNFKMKCYCVILCSQPLR